MLQPLGDRVLLQQGKDEEKTSGGLIIPQTAQERTQYGLVVAIGDDTETINVKVGQTVMYDKHSGTSVKEDGKEFILIRVVDLLAIIEE